MSLCKSQLQSMANAIRFLSADAIEKSKSGHPGMPLGMADVATVLFSKFIKLDAANPRWFDRDRFVLSAGHGALLAALFDRLRGYLPRRPQEFSPARGQNRRPPGVRTPGRD